MARALDDDHYRRSTRRGGRRHARANPRAALWQPKEDARACTRCNARFSKCQGGSTTAALSAGLLPGLLPEADQGADLRQQDADAVATTAQRGGAREAGEARARDNAFLGGADESPARFRPRSTSRRRLRRRGCLALSRHEITAPPPAGKWGSSCGRPFCSLVLCSRCFTRRSRRQQAASKRQLYPS